MHTKYRPDIDGLRAIAVLSVVAFHAFPGWIKGGFIGVDIFFVISGFLISTIIFREIDNQQFSILTFYTRRIKRIFPALTLVLFSLLVLGWFVLLANEYAQLGKHVAAGAGFISNIVLWNESGYFDTSSETKLLLHLWSLGIEEQFYIFWPLILIVICRFKKKSITVVLALTLLSFILNLIEIHTDPVATFYLPQTRAWELLIGALTAWFILHKQNMYQRFNIVQSNTISFIGISLILLGMAITNKQSVFPGWIALLPVIGASFIILAGEKAWINTRLLSHPFMIWFGLISFPLYLWHWPLLSLAHILENETPTKYIRLLVVFISIVLAWLTFKLVELPLRSKKINNLHIYILLLLMLGLGAAGSLIFINNGLPNRSFVIHNTDPKQIATFESFPPTSCITNTTVNRADNFCKKYSLSNPLKKIVLWGDSSTGAWLPVFQKIGFEHNYAIFNIMHPSCPPILEARKTRFDFPESRKYCTDGKIQAEAIELIRAINPDKIVVISAWNAYSAYSQREFLTDRENKDADTISTTRVLENNIPITLATLSRIAPTTVFTSWPMLSQMPKNRTLSFLTQEKNNVSVSKEEFLLDTTQLDKIFEKIIDKNIYFFEPSKKICTNKNCSTMIDGVNLYADRYHITPQGSLLFKVDIEEFLLN